MLPNSLPQQGFHPDTPPVLTQVHNAIDNEMQVSAIGEIAAEEWLKTAQIRSNVELDEWVVMPNHFHAILGMRSIEPLGEPMAIVETTRRVVSTGASRLQPNSLGSIVG